MDPKTQVEKTETDTADATAAGGADNPANTAGEAAAEVAKRFTDMLVRAEIKTAAAGKLADPELAVKLIDVTPVLRLTRTAALTQRV